MWRVVLHWFVHPNYTTRSRDTIHYCALAANFVELSFRGSLAFSMLNIPPGELPPLGRKAFGPWTSLSLPRKCKLYDAVRLLEPIALSDFVHNTLFEMAVILPVIQKSSLRIPLIAWCKCYECSYLGSLATMDATAALRCIGQKKKKKIFLHI